MYRTTLLGPAYGMRRVRAVRVWSLLAGCLGLLLAGCPASERPPQQPPPALVAVSTVLEREVTIEQTFVGTVKPLRVSTVGSLMEGRVVEFLVNEGDYVRAKEKTERGNPNGRETEDVRPLVRLRTESVEIELAAARAELSVREAEWSELTASAPKEIDQARARKEAAAALREFTQSRLKRTRELHAQGVASADELEEQESAAEAAEKAYVEKNAALELAESGLWDEKINQAKARVEIQQETIRGLEDDLEQHEVYAPFCGYVTKEYTEVGQWIGKGDPIVEMVELDEVDVEVAVPENHIAHVSQLPHGTTVPVQIDALPEAKWTGSVALVIPKADVRSRSFPVKVRLENPQNPADPDDLILKPGMFARVTLPVEKRVMRLVPKDALVLGGTSPMVWVIERNPSTRVPETAKVTGLQIEPGASVELEDADGLRSWIEIRGPRRADGSLPLKPGQLVIVEGNERIREGQTVNIVKTLARSL